MSEIIYSDTALPSGTADERLQALHIYAERVFGEARIAERWLSRPNPAIRGGNAPALACSTASGYFEAMADLARIERFEKREAEKRARFGEPRRPASYLRRMLA